MTSNLALAFGIHTALLVIHYSKISLKHWFFGMLGFKSYNCWGGNPTPILWIIVQMAPNPHWL
jgi:hypothetical protein